MEIVTRHINLPKVPEALVAEALAIVSDPVNQARWLNPSKIFGFINLTTAGIVSLDTWLRAHIADTLWHLSFFHADVYVHKDSYTRSRLLYLLDPGGEDVRTDFYEDDKSTLIRSERINQQEWTLLNGNRYHGISAIEPGRSRYAFSARIHPSLWPDKINNPYREVYYRLAVGLPELDKGVIKALLSAVLTSGLKDLANTSIYQRVRLADLGLDYYLHHLCAHVNVGDWEVEWISGLVHLEQPVQQTSVQLCLTLTSPDIATIEYKELGLKRYDLIKERWYLDVVDCNRTVTGADTQTPIINLICPLLSKWT